MYLCFYFLFQPHFASVASFHFQFWSYKLIIHVAELSIKPSRSLRKHQCFPKHTVCMTSLSYINSRCSYAQSPCMGLDVSANFCFTWFLIFPTANSFSHLLTSVCRFSPKNINRNPKYGNVFPFYPTHRFSEWVRFCTADSRYKNLKTERFKASSTLQNSAVFSTFEIRGSKILEVGGKSILLINHCSFSALLQIYHYSLFLFLQVQVGFLTCYLLSCFIFMSITS